MNKTPEQMAEEHANNSGELEDTYVWRADRDGFLAGYQAAKELYAAKLKEANDTVAGMADECEGLKTIIYDHDETNLPTSAKWISVKERLPEDGRTVIYRISVVTPNGNRWKLDYGEWDANEQTFFGEFFDHRELGWDVTHWMELPEPPKEEK